MTVLIRDIPPTYDWGWFSREDQRMHVQTVDKEHHRLHYKVWLENRGRRVIEPEPGIPAKVLKPLRAAIIRERQRLELYWAAFMIKQGWLKAYLEGSNIKLVAYPKTPNRFERVVRLDAMIPNESVAEKVSRQDVALNEEFAFLEIFPQRDEAGRVHEPLDKVLWVD